MPVFVRGGSCWFLLPNVFWNKVRAKFSFFFPFSTIFKNRKMEAGHRGKKVNTQHLNNLNKTTFD